MKTITFTTLLFCFSFSILIAQETVLLNPNQSLIYLNPSFAGSNGFIRNQLTYNNRWPAMNNRQVFYLNSFDAKIKAINGGVAISLYSDDQAFGTLKTTQLAFAYAQHISLLDNALKIVPSVQLAYSLQKLDVASLNFGDMTNPRYGLVWNNRAIIPVANKNYNDISTGILGSYKSLNIGFTAKHINQPDIGLIGKFRLPVFYCTHTSYSQQINDKTLLQFFSMYVSQAQYQMFNLKVNAILASQIIAGAGYGSSGDVTLNAGYRGKFISLVVGHDRTVSKLISNRAGSYTVMFCYSPRKKSFIPYTFENW